jgi:hypothetical protein
MRRRSAPVAVAVVVVVVVVVDRAVRSAGNSVSD